jgi:hypothetical protein
MPGSSSVTKGSAPVDDGFLLVSEEERPSVEADPIARRYLRRFVGAKELIHGAERWCLWLEAADPKDLRQNPEIRRRLKGVADFRMASTKALTRALAASPFLFGEQRQPTLSYLCIPRHVSETRRYFPVARLSPDVVSGDHNFVAQDPDAILFAVLSSSMFIAWLRAIGGRLRDDLRFSNTLVWNTFPFPALDGVSKTRLSEAAQVVLDARAVHPDASLADLYDPLAMPVGLVKAHDELDRVVDSLFAPRKKFRSDADRLSVLFERYQQLTSPLLTSAPRVRKSN